MRAAEANRDMPPCRQRRLLNRCIGTAQQAIGETLAVEAQGVEVHRQRTPGRYHVGNAIERFARQRIAAGHDLVTERRIDAIAEFERQCSVAQVEQARHQPTMRCGSQVTSPGHGVQQTDRRDHQDEGRQGGARDPRQLPVGHALQDEQVEADRRRDLRHLDHHDQEDTEPDQVDAGRHDGGLDHANG
jgi:hypothetical protein